MVDPDSTIPEEIREILEEEGFDKKRKHSRWNYTHAFAHKNADTPRNSLTRNDVEQVLERHFDDLKFENTRSTSNNALDDLVEADILEVEKMNSGHLYWLAHSLNTADSQTSEPTNDLSAGAVQPTEHDSSAPSTTSTSSAEPTAAHSGDNVARSSSLQLRGMVSLLTLTAGMSLTIVTLVLLRLPVVTAPWLESAVLAWILISLGVAAGTVTVAQWVRRDLGASFDISSW
ncbi:hypothetical protein [Haloarcula laminariae]|uniref:hypothetical protein n=1 Tax=Haloarcula laminariae TaxID=2961577 RepID=UPI0021C5A38F|nr:hypothetical protein [Halomicroarcula laminariae]